MTSNAEKVKAVFLSAIEKYAPEQWPVYLDGVCGDDAEMRGRMDYLLKAHRDLGSIQIDLPPEVAATIDQPPTASPGTVIGPFKLLEQIGEGGMGLVYMAEQQHPLRRMVALKIIKPGMDSRQVLARFEAEKQALAMMDHENIAKVFDAGTTDAGHPYFVMELVRGIPIDAFCDQKRLTVRQRLELFIQVCHAVQHAHQKGVIHRDLKPSNVLVTMHDATAVSKVIDFGIAKALGPSLTEQTLHTGFAQLVGTPLYMSPEQAEMNQLGVDTRSDVYSLGVLLYELLTGTTPFDKEALGGSGLEEMRRMIREDEPPRPSARVSSLQPEALSTTSQRRGTDPRRISAALHGELDWIVMKSLEKDRGRRYESASAFATDVQRYLDDEPVLAGPPSTMYKFHKFARKHRAALATAVAIAASLILGTTASAWQAVRATTAEAQANANATQAEEKAQEATTQRDLAQRQRDEVKALNDKLVAKEQQLQRTLAALNYQRGQDECEKGEIGPGLLRLVESWRSAIAAGELATGWPHAARANLASWQQHRPELQAVFSHAGSVQSVAFSPDGKTVITASLDRTARLWDAATGRPLALTLKHPSSVNAVAFSPDGKTVITGCGDNTARLWDAATGQPLGPTLTHQGTVRAVAFSPDGKTVITGCNDNTARFWDAATGQPLGPTLTHQGPVTAVAFSPDGKTVATVSDKSARLWDAATGQPLSQTLKHAWVNSVAFSPDGKTVMTGGGGNSARLWDASTGQSLGQPLTHQGQVCAVAFSPDGKTVITGCNDNTARLWDAATGRPFGPTLTHQAMVQAVAFSPDGKTVITASQDNTARLWDVATIRPYSPTLTHPQGIRAVAFSPDGKTVITAGQDNTARLWDAATGQPLGPPLRHPGWVLAVAFSPDGKTVITGSEDKTARLWDAATGQPRGQPLTHQEPVNAVAFSPDGKTVATGSWGRTVRLWDAATGRPLALTLTHPGPVRAVAFSPDGKTVITAGQDKTARLWDAATGQPLGPPLRHPGWVLAVAFSPDGKTVITASQDNTARLWDASTGRPLGPPLTHRGVVWATAFSPDGKTVITGSEDNTARLWDPSTGLPLGPPLTHESRVTAVAFSPGGKTVVTGSSDKTARVWDVAAALPDELERVATWVEVLTGLELDELGSARVLDSATWLQRQEKLKQLGGSPVARSER